jgi:hypothetical protein
MKNRALKTLGLLLVVFVFLNSCEKNSDDSIDVNFLYGIWALDDFDIDGTMNGKTPEDFIEDEFGITGAIAQVMIAEVMDQAEEEMELPTAITFKEDNTFEATFDYGTEEGEWSYVGEILTINPGDINEIEIDIISLSENEFVGEINEIIEEDFTEDGTAETLDFTAKITYVK